ncbi:hypothetical protein [Lysinibacillus fusiformis]|uniref:hypothetical protein n=1 Tax=Lysinibacillus fusiformis TaxID=28031 RepID=UPI003CFF7331
MTEPTPAYVYLLIFGGLAALILLVAAATAWAHLSRRADRRANLRAVADTDTGVIRLRALRDTPDALMTRDLWAELTHLEFAAGIAVGLVVGWLFAEGVRVGRRPPVDSFEELAQHVEGQRPHLPMPGFDPEEVR